MSAMPKPIGDPKQNPYFYETPEDEFWRDVYLLAMKSGNDDPSVIADEAVASRRLRGRRNFGVSYMLWVCTTRAVFWIAVITAIWGIARVATEYADMLHEIRAQNAAAHEEQ